MENETGGPWVASGQHQGARPFPASAQKSWPLCLQCQDLPVPKEGLSSSPWPRPLSSISLGRTWTSICRPIVMGKWNPGVYIPRDQQALFATYPLVNIFSPKTMVFSVELKTLILLSTHRSL